LSLLGAVLAFSLTLSADTPEPAPPTGNSTLRGTVRLADSGAPLHHASVLLSPLGLRTSTAEDGTFTFQNLPAGTYSVSTHMHALSDEAQTVTLAAGATQQLEFKVKLSALHESVTVTASGSEQSVSEAIQSVIAVEGFDLTVKSGSTSLGDLLENETGVSKRSFGPGTTRPVVRGFDGDRVLVLQDGMRTGTVSSQSGDHGEPVDTSSIERVEVVKGPATLLYGSSAIGGVVNVLTDHHILAQHPHDGLHMSLSVVGGSGNAQFGGGGNFEYGAGPWMFYGSGGGSRTADYNTPLGSILNSGSDLSSFKTGVGRFGSRFSFNTNFQHYETTYGIPAASAQDELPLLDMRRNALRFNGAVKEVKAFEQIQYDLSYTDYTHREIVEGVTGTQFFNKQFNSRIGFEQKRKGRWSGRFGGWQLYRDYKAVGEEALTPPVTQHGLAAFGLEEFTYGRLRLQFGARLENNRYRPDGLEYRSFTGVSASTGAYLPTWKSGAVVVNYMHSYRAPALEELYNLGPHPGNLAFEIGNPNLRREKADGVEAGLRHQTARLRLEASAFRYHMHDFVYFSPTGEVEDGLNVYQYQQADTRFLGAEAKAQFRLADPLWLMAGFDYVDANVATTRLNLPRIPPAHGRLGLNYSWRGLNLRPELQLANRQSQVAPLETATAGYAVFGLNSSYTYTARHLMHTFSLNTFNLGNTVYRNHLSFIKDFAPEMGRGFRVGYTVRWF